MSASAPLIRRLDPAGGPAAVEGLYQAAAAFWRMTDRRPPDRQKAAEVFTVGPPGKEPAASHRLGLFEQDRLAGLAELSFGFPEPEDSSLGLMLLDPAARGRGLGPRFLSEVERVARARACPRLLLAVLEENLTGWRFWPRQGFSQTGLNRFDDETGHWIHRFSKAL